MPIEINNSNLNAASSTEQQSVERREHAAQSDRKTETQDKSAVRSRSDSVELSRDAHSLKLLHERLERQDSFDQERVEAIKAAISEGRYPIDNERLARNFYELESQLSQ